MDRSDQLTMKISLDLDNIIEKTTLCEKVLHMYESSIYNQGNGYNPDNLLYAYKMLEKVQKVALSARMMRQEFCPEELTEAQLDELNGKVGVDCVNSVNTIETALRQLFPNFFALASTD